MPRSIGSSAGCRKRLDVTQKKPARRSPIEHLGELRKRDGVPAAAHQPPATFSNEERETIRKAVPVEDDREFDALLEQLETCIGLFELNRWRERADVQRSQLEAVAKRAWQLNEALSKVDWSFLVRTDRIDAILSSRARWLHDLSAMEREAKNSRARWKQRLEGLRQRAARAAELPIPADTHAHTASTELIRGISAPYKRLTGEPPESLHQMMAGRPAPSSGLQGSAGTKLLIGMSATKL